jgi:hypothetical protein
MFPISGHPDPSLLNCSPGWSPELQLYRSVCVILNQHRRSHSPCMPPSKKIAICMHLTHGANKWMTQLASRRPERACVWMPHGPPIRCNRTSAPRVRPVPRCVVPPSSARPLPSMSHPHRAPSPEWEIFHWKICCNMEQCEMQHQKYYLFATSEQVYYNIRIRWL